jgi:hypothetical protein
MEGARGCLSTLGYWVPCLTQLAGVGGGLCGAVGGAIWGAGRYGTLGAILGVPVGAFAGIVAAWVLLLLAYGLLAVLGAVLEGNPRELIRRRAPLTRGEMLGVAIFLAGASAGGVIGYREYGLLGAILGIPVGAVTLIVSLVLVGVIVVATAGWVWRSVRRPSDTTPPAPPDAADQPNEQGG